MPILQPKERQLLKKRLDTELKRDVTVTLYTQPETKLYVPGRDCPTCGPTQRLLEEVSELSRRLHLKVVDFYNSRKDAEDQRVEKIPAIAIGADGRTNARFYGMPTGFEFAVLLGTASAASEKRSSLQLETRRKLKSLEDDVHIQVFVTPDCQFCPIVARVAHAMALESDKVTADVVEMQEFPHLAQVYSVMGVPKTVINDRVQFTGGVSEDVFIQRVLEAVGDTQPAAEENGPVSDQTTPFA